MDGRIVEVVERMLGSSLAADAAIGATTVFVADAADFDEDGSALVDGELVAYSIADEDSGELALGAPLVSAHPIDGLVVCWPQTIERSATLIGADDGDGEEGMLARIPHALFDRIPVGVRDELGETVQAGYLSDELVVLDLTGEAPVVDGSYIDEDTLPAPPDGAGSDGSAPGASPTPTLVAGIGTIHALWNATTNADPVSYAVHLGTASGFAPSAATLVAETPATALTIRATPADDLPLDYATVYYVRLVASDADGAAPPSVEASKSPVQVTGPDIVAESITSEHIVAEAITADHLAAVLVTASQIITPAETGRRVVIDPAGIRLIASDETTLVNLPTDAGQAPFFGGNVTTGGLTVTGNARIQGATNQMEKGSQLTLQGQLGAPAAAPQLAFEYDTASIGIPGIQGCDYDPAGYLVGGGSGRTYVLIRDGGDGNYELLEYDIAGDDISRRTNLFATGSYDLLGVARCGAYIHVVFQQVSTGEVRIRAFNQSDLTIDRTVVLSGTTGLGPTDRIVAGGDGTNVIFITWSTTSGSSAKQYTVYHGTTLALLTSDPLVGGLTRSAGKYFAGVTGRGGTLCVATWRDVAAGNITTYELYNPSTKAKLTSDGNTWSVNALANSGNSVATAWQGGVTYDTSLSAWRAVCQSGIVAKFTGFVWPVDATGNTFYCGSTFFQTTGSLETRISPLGQMRLDGANADTGHGAATDYAMRGQLRVISPPIPTDASTERIYMLRASSPPANTTTRRQAPAATSNVPGISFTFYIRAYDAAGALYVDANTFPTGTSIITGDIGANVTAQWILSGGGAFVLPRMTTAQRPAAPPKAHMQWNESRGVPEFYDGAKWITGGVEIVTVNVNLPSTGAHTSGNIGTLAIPGLNVGDYCFWLGATSNQGISFHLRTQPVCTVAGQIRLDFYNADNVTNDPNAADHLFMIVRQT